MMLDKRLCNIALVFYIVIQIHEHVVHGTEALAADYCRSTRDPILGLEERRQFGSRIIRVKSPSMFTIDIVDEKTSAQFFNSVIFLAKDQLHITVDQNGFFHKKYYLQKVHIFINGAESIPGSPPTVPVDDKGDSQKTERLTLTGIIQQRKLAQYIIRMYSNILSTRSCKMLSYPRYSHGGYKMAFIQELRNGSNFDVTDHIIQHPLIATEVLEQACGNLSEILNNIVYNVPVKILKSLNLDNCKTAVKIQTLKWIPILLCNKSRKFDYSKFPNWEESSVLKTFSVINDNYNFIRKNKKISPFSRICINPLIDYLIMELKTDGAVDPLTIYNVNGALFTSVLLTLTRGHLQFPRPASRLAFEVYSTRTGINPTKYLRVLYNGQDITHEVPMCNKMAARHSPCRLKYFTDFNKTFI